MSTGICEEDWISNHTDNKVKPSSYLDIQKMCFIIGVTLIKNKETPACAVLYLWFHWLSETYSYHLSIIIYKMPAKCHIPEDVLITISVSKWWNK